MNETDVRREQEEKSLKLSLLYVSENVLYHHTVCYNIRWRKNECFSHSIYHKAFYIIKFSIILLFYYDRRRHMLVFLETSKYKY